MNFMQSETTTFLTISSQMHPNSKVILNRSQKANFFCIIRIDSIFIIIFLMKQQNLRNLGLTAMILFHFPNQMGLYSLISLKWIRNLLLYFSKIQLQARKSYFGLDSANKLVWPRKLIRSFLKTLQSYKN